MFNENNRINNIYLNVSYCTDGHSFMFGFKLNCLTTNDG